jgi:hypothetical protein
MKHHIQSVTERHPCRRLMKASSSSIFLDFPEIVNLFCVRVALSIRLPQYCMVGLRVPLSQSANVYVGFLSRLLAI